MKIEVQLYGTLQTKTAGSPHQREIEIEIPDGAKPMDLLNYLKIHDQQHVVITKEGRIFQADDELQDGDTIRIFQAVYGG